MSFEEELHGKLGHLSRALGVAMQVIADIERDLARAAADASAGGYERGDGPRGPRDAPIYPQRVEPSGEEAAVRAAEPPDGAAAPPGAEAARVAPPWPYVVPPWAWSGAPVWWPAFFGGWPLGGAAPWSPHALGWGLPHGFGPAFGSWPPPPWWSGVGPVWPTAPVSPPPGRTGRDDAPVDLSGGTSDAADEPRRSRGGGSAGTDRTDAAAVHGREVARPSSRPDGASRDEPADPWTWRWTNPEDRRDAR